MLGQKQKQSHLQSGEDISRINSIGVPQCSVYRILWLVHISFIKSSQESIISTMVTAGEVLDIIRIMILDNESNLGISSFASRLWLTADRLQIITRSYDSENYSRKRVRDCIGREQGKPTAHCAYLARSHNLLSPCLRFLTFTSNSWFFLHSDRIVYLSQLGHFQERPKISRFGVSTTSNYHTRNTQGITMADSPKYHPMQWQGESHHASLSWSITSGSLVKSGFRVRSPMALIQRISCSGRKIVVFLENKNKLSLLIKTHRFR